MVKADYVLESRFMMAIANGCRSALKYRTAACIPEKQSVDANIAGEPQTMLEFKMIVQAQSLTTFSLLLIRDH